MSHYEQIQKLQKMFFKRDLDRVQGRVKGDIPYFCNSKIGKSTKHSCMTRPVVVCVVGEL